MAPQSTATPVTSSPALPSTDADAAALAAPAEPGAAADPDAGAPAQFRTCTFDSDCVAVDRVACCHNGWKESVANSQKEAYAKSFTCPQAHPICPMYLVHDARVPQCDNATHLCTMTRAEDIACGGFIRNKHVCPSGYHCQLSRHPDVPGKCVRP
jgi:hypothetical protein